MSTLPASTPVPPISFGWMRLLAFLLLFGTFYGGLELAWTQGLSHVMIDIATVEPAAWLARVLTGDSAIQALGSRIQSPGASVNVLFGCEGTDVLMLLVSAVLVTPVAWRKRLPGLLAGAAFVFAVNQARVLALFLSMRSHRQWFAPLHGFVAPLATVVLVTMFFLLWLRSLQETGPRRAVAA
jgi:exosortase family protein XrtM